MDIYENTLIGSFLYGLGVEIGRRSNDRPLAAGVDLLQQTPFDTSLADLLVGAPRFFRLFEFKRVQNASRKETRKQASLLTFLTGHRESAELLQTSAAIHFHVQIGYAGELPEGSPALTTSPYLGGSSIETSITALCADTAASMHAPPARPTPAACARYLAVLTQTQGRLKRGSGGGTTLLVAQRHGQLEQAHVPDLRDFGRRAAELMAVQQELDRALARIRVQERQAAIENGRQARESRRTCSDHELGS